ncbi:MAG: shikimate dehydrogenase [SAR324 cluster bacterium]|nr:shikimate dehydrogenase [SAR324 cluster bacterium]MBL7036189.1 shikimate dehydrogenase [SAR324 cluster bacterium]
MRRSITGKTRIYGIIGHPVEHSLSPQMQNAAFSALKIDACYLAFSVQPEDVMQAVAGLKALNIAGINVTVPHKSAVIPLLDEISPLAKQLGAVNTIRNEQGCLSGTNTDISGFIRSLQDLQFSSKDKTIALLGAGGSARAVLAGLADAGASRILIHNRTLERAEKLITDFAPLFPAVKLEAVELETLQKTNLDLLVNTTTVGMKSGASPLDLSQCQSVLHLVDLIYSPAQTALLKQAEELAVPAINGLGMLLYQGCEAFTFWTGKSAPEKEMRAQLLNAIE